MTLEKSDRFDKELQTITLFIALDNPHRALKFLDDIITKIEDIPLNPFSHRQIKYSVDTLFFCGINEPTGIDNDHICLSIIISDLILFKPAQHHFAVDKVFSTAKTDQV